MRGDRALAVLLGCLGGGLLALLLYWHGPSASWLPDCLFHRMTGFDCPGCGMTRAAHAALHGRFGEAFRFNPLGMVLFPAVLVGLALELVAWVCGSALPLRFRIGARWGWGVFGLLMAFWVFRNIPAWPFTLLAPP